MAKASSKSYREGISIIDVMDIFPTEESATIWFESVFWPDGRHCPRCGGHNTKPVPNAKPMPYWCTDCRKYFSVRTGTAIARSNVPLRKWAIAIHLCLASFKRVAGKKLAQDIEVSQPTAWFMLRRIREGWSGEGDGPFEGPVEVDETYMSGKRRSMFEAKRKTLAGQEQSARRRWLGLRIERLTRSTPR